MLILYDFGIRLYHFSIIIYQFFNKKAKLWIEGRKNIFSRISDEVNRDSKCVWFHFASLGEFEQGRPVLEHLRKQYPQEKIIVTFFSPSGYEMRKNYASADHVFYLPLDKKANAQKFITLINPKVAIFTKYEYWYHYFYELQRRQIPIILISAIFRKNQPFFKWYGSLNRKILGFVDHFFVQDENSRRLLESIHITKVTVSGDTRFDRVAENAVSPARFPEIETFCGGSQIFIAGSTWPDDEKLIIDLIKSEGNWKFIIAPHEIKEENINRIIRMLSPGITERYSDLQVNPLKETTAQVLIIDNIGMLSSLYQYCQIAYIGGGFGVGIHNTLEAAAFGLPVIFGPNYQKFREARELIATGAAFSIKHTSELLNIFDVLKDEAAREKASKAAKRYVKEETGATEKIINYLDAIVFN